MLTILRYFFNQLLRTSLVFGPKKRQKKVQVKFKCQQHRTVLNPIKLFRSYISCFRYLLPVKNLVIVRTKCPASFCPVSRIIHFKYISFRSLILHFHLFLIHDSISSNSKHSTFLELDQKELYSKINHKLVTTDYMTPSSNYSQQCILPICM